MLSFPGSKSNILRSFSQLTRLFYLFVCEITNSHYYIICPNIDIEGSGLKYCDICFFSPVSSIYEVLRNDVKNIKIDIVYCDETQKCCNFILRQCRPVGMESVSPLEKLNQCIPHIQLN